MLTIHTMSDSVENETIETAPGAEFDTLLAWVRRAGLSMRPDPESDATITGWFIESGGVISAAGISEIIVVAGATYPS